MAMATCWNCGARLTGSRCQWCGEAQKQGAPQGPSPYAGNTPPGRQFQPPMPGQPSDWQHQRTVVNQPEGWQAWRTVSGGQQTYVPDRQPDMSGYPQDRPYQQPEMAGYGPGWSSQASGAGYYVPGGQPQRAPAGQMMGPQPVAPAARPAMRAQPRGPEALAVPLALLGGLAGGLIGAAIWAFILDLTRINFAYLAFALGIIVGLGVALGARGHHDIGLSLFAGVLGLLSYFFALYFRLSLAESHALGESANLFALSLNDFSNILGAYLPANPINFLNFALVPLAAMGTAYRYISRGRGRG